MPAFSKTGRARESTRGLTYLGGRAMTDLQETALGMGEAIPQELLSGFPQFLEGVPGATPTQQMSLAGLENMAMGNQPGGGGGLERGRQAIEQVMGGLPGFDEFYNANVYDPAIEALTRRGGTLDALTAGASGTGNRFAGLSALEKGQASGDVLRELVRQRGAMRLPYETTRQNFLLAGAEQLAQNEIMKNALLQNLYGVGGEERNIQLQQRQGRLEEFQRALQERDLRLALLQQAINPAGRALPGEYGPVEGGITRGLDAFSKWYQAYGQAGSILSSASGAGGGMPTGG